MISITAFNWVPPFAQGQVPGWLKSSPSADAHGVFMTMPMDYAHASEQFDRFVEELRVKLDHETRHQTFQTIQSGLRVFRRRLSVAEALRFAEALPVVLRAIFVEDWDVEEPVVPLGTLTDMNQEVRQSHINHDCSPPTAIEDVACVLRNHFDRVAFDRVLQRLPPEATTFWHVTAQ